jgi:ABC-type hemin transport system substrate-binding protein
VSLVPSTTRTVADLGAANRLVGVTRFCVSPPSVRALPKVGGTKDVAVERVLALRPDLVLANAEENTREIVESLAPHVPLWAPLPRTLDDAVTDVIATADLLHVAVGGWPARLAEARAHLCRSARPLRVAYLIWNDPVMTVASDTFVHAVLGEAGLTNVFADRADRYPVVTADDLAAADPDLVLLSTEPFPFRARHADALATASGLPRARFRQVDGEACTWHGTRLVPGLATLAACLRHGFPEVPA